MLAKDKPGAEWQKVCERVSMGSSHLARPGMLDAAAGRAATGTDTGAGSVQIPAPGQGGHDGARLFRDARNCRASKGYCYRISQPWLREV